MTDGSLGLPSSAGQLPTDKPRQYREWTLPQSKVGAQFADQFADADRTFRLVEVTPEQQDQAAGVAQGNNSILSRELIYASLYQIGDWKVSANRIRLNDWWRAIGQPGRRLVEAAFLSMASVSEADVQNFLASGSSGNS